MKSNNVIISDFITNKEYRVPTSLNRQVNLYKLRYIIGLSMFALLYSFNVSVLFCSLIGFGFMAVAEISYRIRFLPKCTVLPTKPKKNTLNKPSIIMNSILYLILGIVLAIYPSFESMDSLYAYVCYGISAVAIVVSITYFIRLRKN